MRVPLSRGTDERSDGRTDSSGADSGRATSPGSGLVARLAEGAKGGLVATLAMTAYRLPVSRSLPPTAEFWTKFVSGGDPDDHPVPAVVLHLLYGVAGGVGFGLLAPIDADAGARSGDRQNSGMAVERDSANDHRETARLEAVGLLTGVLYALALSAFGERVVLGRLLDTDLRGDESLVFHAGHVVYGLSLGTWFGSRTGDRR